MTTHHNRTPDQETALTPALTPEPAPAIPELTIKEIADMAQDLADDLQYGAIAIDIQGFRVLTYMIEHTEMKSVVLQNALQSIRQYVTDITLQNNAAAEAHEWAQELVDHQKVVFPSANESRALVRKMDRLDPEQTVVFQARNGDDSGDGSRASIEISAQTIRNYVCIYEATRNYVNVESSSRHTMLSYSMETINRDVSSTFAKMRVERIISDFNAQTGDSDRLPGIADVLWANADARTILGGTADDGEYHPPFMR